MMSPGNTPPRFKTDRPYRPNKLSMRANTRMFPPELVARDQATPAFESFSRTNGTLGSRGL